MPEYIDVDVRLPRFKTLADGQKYRAIKYFDNYREAVAYRKKVCGLFEAIDILAESGFPGIWIVWARPTDRFPQLPPA